MKLSHSLRAVCFDIGGVLVDVGDGFLAEELAGILATPAQLVRRLLVQHGKERPCAPADLATALSDGCQRPDKYNEVLEAVLSRYDAIAHPVLYPDALPVLEELRKAGWRVAFLSNSIGHPGYFRRPAYFDYAETVVHSWEIGACKPNRRAFQAIEVRTGLGPHELVSVGDSVDADVKGALSAGWTAVHLPRTGRPSAPAQLAPTITSLHQLLNLLPERIR